MEYQANMTISVVIPVS